MILASGNMIIHNFSCMVCYTTILSLIWKDINYTVCLSVGSKPELAGCDRLEREPSTFIFRTLIVTVIPTARTIMWWWLEMIMMTVSVMVLAVVMSMMMIMICYCCQWQCWEFNRWREVVQIQWLYQVDGRGPSKQRWDRWNHIKWNECDWAPGLSSTHRPPPVSRLHCEGQRRRIQKLYVIYWRVLRGMCDCRLLYIWM